MILLDLATVVFAVAMVRWVYKNYGLLAGSLAFLAITGIPYFIVWG